MILGIIRKTLGAAAFVAASAIGASAATVDQVTAVVGGPAIAGSGNLFVEGGAATQFFGFPPSPGTQGVVAGSSFSVAGSPGIGGMELVVTELPPPPPAIAFPPFDNLFGTEVDQDISGSLAKILFSVVGGSLAPAFGDYALLTFSTIGGFTDDDTGNIGRFTLVAVEVEDSNIIPLPAGAVLLISGLAMFGAARRRAS